MSDIKPWTIKNISPEIRNAAIAAAERAGQTIGEWLGRAILAQVKADRQGPASLVPVLALDPVADLDAIERMVALSMQLSQASGGTAPPASFTRLTYGLLRSRLQSIKASPTRRAPQSVLEAAE